VQVLVTTDSEEESDDDGEGSDAED
jgi:hypothetical protein